MSQIHLDSLTQQQAGEFADATCPEDVLHDAAQKLKVCGHPVRLKLLCMISQHSQPCVSELWVCLNQPQPVISQHLAILKDKGIVQSEVQGNKRIYHIVDPFIERLVHSIQKKVEEVQEV
jgi:DNA-binding transcriptional ArsR family regulator